jgi:hypothetical protein
LCAVPDKLCQLRWSTQHLLEVYSQEFEIPAFFSDVDSSAARPEPTLLSQEMHEAALLSLSHVFGQVRNTQELTHFLASANSASAGAESIRSHAAF